MDKKKSYIDYNPPKSIVFGKLNECLEVQNAIISTTTESAGRN